jgi:amino acid transporter
VPRAIVLVALIGGGIFIVVTYFVTLVSPGGTFANSSSLASDIAKTIGGSLFGAVFLTGLIVGQFASGLAAQAAVARLLYAMGRDRVLPQRVFGWVSERFHTPVFNIALCGVIGLAAIFLDVATSTSFINFGAFTAADPRADQGAAGDDRDRRGRATTRSRSESIVTVRFHTHGSACRV